MNALLFTIAHTVFAYSCLWLINRYGMRFTIIIGGVLICTGVWFRTFIAYYTPAFCLFGSLLSAIGGIFIVNSPAKVAFNWFKSETVPLITFTTVLSNMLSSTIGVVIPTLFISPTSTQQQIVNFLQIEAAFITVSLIISNLFFRERPKKAPSKAADLVLTKQDKNIQY